MMQTFEKVVAENNLKSVLKIQTISFVQQK
jgi:hypothetical protein